MLNFREAKLISSNTLATTVLKIYIKFVAEKVFVQHDYDVLLDS
jgi:hypothetical protein